MMKKSEGFLRRVMNLAYGTAKEKYHVLSTLTKSIYYRYPNMKKGISFNSFFLECLHPIAKKFKVLLL
jgi:hypothetical protein